MSLSIQEYQEIIQPTLFTRAPLESQGIHEDLKGHVQLLAVMGDDLTIVNAAKVSFYSEAAAWGDDCTRLIKYLAKHKHFSPFEHASLTFRIKTYLPIAKQHMRHRTQSYNEISRRYTSDNIEFHIPQVFRKQAKKNKQGSEGQLDEEANAVALDIVTKLASQSLEAYEALLMLGVCKEQARGYLIQATYTEYWATANLRNWLQYLDLRLDEHAQQEIREVALCIYEMIKKRFPFACEAWELANQNT
jgi:thymidylate synthase (FAD)